MINVGVTLAEEIGGLPRRSCREAQNPDAVQILDGSLLSPPGNHGRHLDAPQRQLSSQQPGGSAVAPMLAPREDLHADEAYSHGSRSVGGRLSAIGYRLSAIGYRLSAIGYRLSAIGYRLSAGAKIAAAEDPLLAVSC